MRFVSWIVTVVLTILLVCFALANRDTVSIGLWPLTERVDLRLFVALMLAGFIGFVAGGLVAWSAQSHWRRIARERGRRVQVLTEQVRTLEARLAERREPEAAPALPAASSNPPLRQVAGERG